MNKPYLKRAKLLLIVTWLVVVGPACQSTEPDELPSPVYLEEVIPPCTPIAGSTIDPCEPEQPGHVKKVGSQSSEGLSDPLQTILDLLLGRYPEEATYPSLVPHIVIRGTVQPGTFRCDDYQAKPPNFTSERLHQNAKPIVLVHCFAEVTVKEYLVGEGPPILTVSLHRESLHLSTDVEFRESFIEQQGGEDAWVDNYLDFPAGRADEVYASKELVLFLKIPTITVEAWDTELELAVWFVQQTGDNPPRAVCQDRRLARTPEQRARLDMPLAELEQQVRAAAKNRTAVTGGRVGMASNLPLLVTDANKLRDFYGAVGAVYDGSENSTVLPPPVPGADQPPGPPANTGENETPNGTPPTPGNDQTPPTPGDDDQPPPSTP